MEEEQITENFSTDSGTQSGPITASYTPTLEPKNKNNQLFLVIIIIVQFVIIIVLAAAMFISKTESDETSNLTSVTSVEVMQSPTPTDDLRTSSVKVLSVESLCVKDGSDIQLETTKAYLAPTVLGFPTVKSEEIARDYPDYYPSSFLIIESNARNSSVGTGSYKTVYAADYFRLVRDSLDFKPIIYGGPNLGAQENGTVFAFFPIKTDEEVFQVTFCDFINPTVLVVDFTTSDVQVVRGDFFVDKGFTQSFN